MELADGGLDWLIETGGLQSNPHFFGWWSEKKRPILLLGGGEAGGSPKGAEMKW